jgi:Bacterial type III secretion protein (HrpB4)
MTAMASAAASSLRRLMRAAHDKSARLAQHMHPQWVAAALPNHVAWAVQGGGGVFRASLGLAELYGVRWPDLVSLRGRAHRLALLERPATLQVLAAAALYTRRGAVRRCVGRQARQDLVALVGEPAFAALLDMPDTAERHAAQDTPLALDAGAEAWAAEGYRALHASRVCTCKNASVIARLTLSPGALDRSGSISGSSEPLLPAEMVAFVQRLETLFPEQSWLFGSDTDRALLASTTA